MKRLTHTAGFATKARKHERNPFPRFHVFAFSWLTLLVVTGAVVDVAAQASKTRTYVETLASPRLEGRLAGSNGERLASEYIVSELKKIGAKPLPGQKDFLIPFEFTAGTKDGGSTVSVGGTAFGAAKTRALSFSDNG